MTLKYTPIHKRVRFALRGEKFTSPDDPILVTSLQAPEQTKIGNTGYYDDAGYFHSSNGKVYTMEVPGISELIVSGFDRSLSPFSGESRLRNALIANSIDLQKANYYFLSPNPLDIAKGAFYYFRGRRSENPEDYDGLITGIADFPFDFKRKSLMKTLNPDSWLSRKLFRNNPNAVRRLRGEPYSTVNEYGEVVTRNPDGSLTVGKPNDKYSVTYSSDYIGRPNPDGYYMGMDGKYHRVENFTPRVETEARVEPEVIEPEVRVETTPQQNRAAEARQKALEEVTRRANDARALLDAEKVAEAKRIAQENRTKAVDRRYKEYAALTDEEIINEYRQIAKARKTNSPGYEAVMRQGRERGIIDENGRVITKKPTTETPTLKPTTETPTLKPTTEGNELKPNTDKSKDETSLWNKVNSAVSGVTKFVPRLFWETEKNNFGNVLGSGYKWRNFGRVAAPFATGEAYRIGNILGGALGGVEKGVIEGVEGYKRGRNLAIEEATPNQLNKSEDNDTIKAGESANQSAPSVLTRVRNAIDVVNMFKL